MINRDAFCQCHDKVETLLTYAFLELKELSGKKEKLLFDQISDKPSSKKAISDTPLLNDAKMET